MPATRIVRNAARCKKCGDVIESKTVHDFVRCRCGAIAVDGGRDYLRRLFEGRYEEAVEDLSVTEEIPDPEEYGGFRAGDEAWDCDPAFGGGARKVRIKRFEAAPYGPPTAVAEGADDPDPYRFRYDPLGDELRIPAQRLARTKEEAFRVQEEAERKDAEEIERLSEILSAYRERKKGGRDAWE